MVQLILNYCCFSHNIHGLAFGSERSPREIAVSRRLPSGEFALFGSRVLAEIPKSVEMLNPNLTRFVSAYYLHPQFSSCGSLVLARIRIKDELVSKMFVAKSLKLVFPIELDFESGMFLILRIKGEEGPRALDFDRSMPRVLPSTQGVSLKCPPSGPPKEFIDRYGISRDCIACRWRDEIGTRKGFSPSKSCCRRYEDWLRTQVQGQDNIEPVVHDTLKEALEECEYEPTTPGDPVEDSLESVGKESGDVVVNESPEPPVKRVKTRHCPACESGMVAPGIRHSKECVRNQENLKRSLEILGMSTHDDSMNEWKDLDNMNHDQKAIDDELAHELGLSSESHDLKRHGESTEDLVVDRGHEHVKDMEVDGAEYLDTGVAMTSSNMKRESEVPLVELEEEIRKETETDNLKRSNVLSSMVSAAFGVSEYVPISEMLVDSVQFGAESDFEVMTFGNQKIKIDLETYFCN